MNSIVETLQDFAFPEIRKYYQNLTNLSHNLAAVYEDLFKEENTQARFFWSFLKKVNLRVHPGFFVDFDSHDGFQLVDLQGRLTYHSLNVATKLKFTLEEVLEKPFDELFERDPFVTRQIMNVFVEIISSQEMRVFDLSAIPQHRVQQKGFANSDYLVKFKKAYPVKNQDGTFYGFVLSLNVFDAPAF